jgi:hypothetical protein
MEEIGTSMTEFQGFTWRVPAAKVHACPLKLSSGERPRSISRPSVAAPAVFRRARSKSGGMNRTWA